MKEANNNVDNQDGQIKQSAKVTSSSQNMMSYITPSTTRLLTFLAVALLIAISGFAGGVQYQKSKSPSTKTAAGQFDAGMGQGRFGGRRSLNGSVGAVTAVSDSSISIQDRRSGSIKTYSITSSTEITNAGVAASANDIVVGDNVIVTTASSASTTATRITLNAGPSGMGGPGGAGAATDPTSQDPQSSI